MSEEHGYQRSGKKCREKFENLYKYYKKTKEGKAGRHDGKHYRFFHQLEALYGESSNSTSASEPHLVGNNNFGYNTLSSQEPFLISKNSDSLSLTNSDFETTSSDDSDVNAAMDNKEKKRSPRSWKAKIKDFIDSQTRKFMEKQEAWLEKMMKTIEHKEFERMLREEEWRKQEEARIDQEHKFWAKERAWIEARDTALVEALQKLTGTEFKEFTNLNQEQNDEKCGAEVDSSWDDLETARLIGFRVSMEVRFQEMGCHEIDLWEEIASKMASLGYGRSPLMCIDKWGTINNLVIRCRMIGNDTVSHQLGEYCDNHHHTSEQLPDRRPPSDCSTCLNMRYLMSGAGGGVGGGSGGNGGESLWGTYDVEIYKGNDN